MDVREFYVSLSPKSALGVLEESLVRGTISGAMVDVYERIVGDKQVVVCVLEKYYMRTSNRASVTITIDNLEENTKVHAAASGGGAGAFLRFDWGAGDSFVTSVERALETYMV
ncbi:DUF6054 family protein [Psychrobacillus sp.]|uniref:DUF6054 family protein n=1 Tax=Psychrobacillus sp. TaxID=1871623 RepID=UPI0028BD3838|nr:DUF6054 family protein [Psychrobacillus sp.]